MSINPYCLKNNSDRKENNFIIRNIGISIPDSRKMVD